MKKIFRKILRVLGVLFCIGWGAGLACLMFESTADFGYKLTFISLGCLVALCLGCAIYGLIGILTDS